MEIPREVEDINDITIPEKCRNCAYQAMLVEQSIESKKGLLSNQQLGFNLIGESGQEFDKMVTELEPEHAEDIQSFFRRMIGETIEDFDKKLDLIKAQAEANARSCDGTVATNITNNGVNYTGYICTSANINMRGQTSTAIIKLKVD